MRRRPPSSTPVASADGAAWPTPQPEFALDRLRFAGSDDGARSLVAHGPTIYLCMEGRFELVERWLTANRSTAITWSPWLQVSRPSLRRAPDVEVNGSGVLMRANPGLTW